MSFFNKTSQNILKNTSSHVDTHSLVMKETSNIHKLWVIKTAGEMVVVLGGLTTKRVMLPIQFPNPLLCFRVAIVHECKTSHCVPDGSWASQQNCSRSSPIVEGSIKLDLFLKITLQCSEPCGQTPMETKAAPWAQGKALLGSEWASEVEDCFSPNAMRTEKALASSRKGLSLFSF